MMEEKTLQLKIENLTFTHDGSFEPVFENLTLRFDTSWRTGLIARNGRGKTTLLRLLTGELHGRGHIDCPLTPVLFPYPVADASDLTWSVMLAAAPDSEDWQLRRELSLLQVDEDVLYRPFDTLSGGEQTKVMLAALFARADVYPLIDEPTNSLDAPGRALLADYLRRKDGFLLVSHDRAFLDRTIDHVVSLNKREPYVMQGNYTTLETRLNAENEAEAARSETLRREIGRLEESARRTAAWSEKVEQSRQHVDLNYYNRNFYGKQGTRFAKMVQRTQNTLRRQERAIEEKKTLLQNVEQVGQLRITTLDHHKDVLLQVKNGLVRYGDHVVCEGVNFTLRRGERVALCGANGCGKSSILKALLGQGGALEGEITRAPGLVCSAVPQRLDELHGSLRDFIQQADADETLFKAILRNMDCPRELFAHDLADMSLGQRKKMLLARALCSPAHLHVWDEPLNFIDVFSRVQLEQLIEEYQPTMLLVEHDARFLQNIGAQCVSLGGKSGETGHENRP